VQGSAPSRNPLPDVSDQGVAADIPIPNRDVCSQKPCQWWLYQDAPMGNHAGAHFPLAGRRGKRMICAVTRKQTKAQRIWAEEKASARKSKPSRIWVRPGLSKKRF